MMPQAIIPIVEGFAEVESVPILMRRVLDGTGAPSISVARPFRVRRYQIVREGQLERALQQAVGSRPAAAGIMLLMDADDDCPARLGPALLERCSKVTQLPVSVVLATREFEAWFLGSKESLRGARGIATNAAAPENPESIRGAKERLTANMQRRRYIAVDDQPALAHAMDLQLAQTRCRSFDKFVREIEYLSSAIAGSPS